MPPSRSARCKVGLLAASMAAILLFSTCTPFLDEEGYIKALNPTLNLSATSLSLYPSGTATLTATLSPATSESISWSSSSTSVATIDSNGKVTALTKGAATITAASSISGKTASCAVTVLAYATVSTLAGSGSSDSVDGTGNAASFYQPYGVAIDSLGYLYVADTYNSKIRKVSPTGAVSTLAGSGSYGSGTAASFDYPNGVAVDSSG